MKVAIMQPYFLPYIGYFQLINAVDVFVFYDDVSYIKQGWINRNRILLDGKDFLFTLELKGSSSFKYINDIEVGNNRRKLLKTITQAYKNAPYHKDVEPILGSAFGSTQKNLSQYIIETHKLLAQYLGIKTKIVISSELNKNNELRGQEKIIDICKKLDAHKYINPIGGTHLYAKDDFHAADIELNFIQSKMIEYNQFTDVFIPWLSIIDVIMFNSVKDIRIILDKFTLI